MRRRSLPKQGGRSERVRSDGVEELHRRLEEAEQALEAIRTGQVESLVVEGPDGPRIFSLEGTDHSYRVLVEAMNEGAATLGANGVILYSNARFAAMLDAPLETVIGSPISRFVPEASRAAFAELVRDASTGESRREIDLASESGARVPALLSASVMHEESSFRLCLVAADIGERRRIETELRALNAELSDTARRRAEFIAVLSHELRNPLAPIMNGLTVLETAAPSAEEAKRAQAVIRRQVGQLVRLVDDLLDVTRISRNRIQLQCERIDLAGIVREVVQDHRANFDACGIRLEAAFPSSPVMVVADRARMGQVVGNLLTNAAKFTPRGGSALVSVSRDSEGQAVVRVAYTGTGMTPEILTRLFEPFAQADRTLDRSKGGLGLGLALVKGLVELHHGEVEGNSAGPGQGAEFVVRLPLDLSDAEDSAREPSRAPQRPWRILVIEDNVDSAESLRMVLEARGHEVEVAFTGSDGLRAAKAWRPELVLCDIGLPGMDGYEVARVLRRDNLLPDAFLVALSGYAMPEDRRRASEAGFDEHIAKPLRMEMFDRVLASLELRPRSTGSQDHDSHPRFS